MRVDAEAIVGQVAMRSLTFTIKGAHDPLLGATVAGGEPNVEMFG